MQPAVFQILNYLPNIYEKYCLIDAITPRRITEDPYFEDWDIYFDPLHDEFKDSLQGNLIKLFTLDAFKEIYSELVDQRYMFIIGKSPRTDKRLIKIANRSRKINMCSNVANFTILYKFADCIDWTYLSWLASVPCYIIEKVKKYINWKNIPQLNYSDEFYERFGDLINWRAVSTNKYLNEKIMRKYKDKLVWNLIGEYQENLSEEFMDEFARKLNWNKLARFQKLSLRLIKKYKDLVDWSIISAKYPLSESFIVEHIDYVDFYKISQYQTLSMEFIIKYKDRLNMKLIEQHQKSFYGISVDWGYNDKYDYW